MNSMKGSFLKKRLKNHPARDVFANKSAVIIEWLLLSGIDRPNFAIREVAGETPVSLGLVHRVFDQLVDVGFLATSGVRTSKTFSVKDPRRLLETWRAHYSIVEKCRMWTYRTGLSGRDAVLSRLGKSTHWQTGTLALHTAASKLGFSHSNMQTTELYLTDPAHRLKLEDLFELEPQDRGYDVLLVQPYYKALLSTNSTCKKQGARLLHSKDGGRLFCAPPLLTYLDLCHYPIRGEEQADVIATRDPAIKRVMRFRTK